MSKIINPANAGINMEILKHWHNSSEIDGSRLAFCFAQMPDKTIKLYGSPEVTKDFILNYLRECVKQMESGEVTETRINTPFLVRN